MRLVGARGLLLVLLASSLLRLGFVIQGGQLLFSDEQRYLRALAFINDTRQVGIGQAAGRLLALPDHVLFGVVALVPASVQNLIERPPRANPDVDDGLGRCRPYPGHYAVPAPTRHLPPTVLEELARCLHPSTRV